MQTLTSTPTLEEFQAQFDTLLRKQQQMMAGYIASYMTGDLVEPNFSRVRDIGIDSPYIRLKGDIDDHPDSETAIEIGEPQTLHKLLWQAWSKAIG